jgi:peptide/nickel transport system substrate-binding protein
MTLGIVPARCARLPECGIGSGPFRLVSHAVDEVVLAAAPTAEPRPRIPGLVFRASPDGVVRALELARGSLDLAENAVDPDVVAWLRKRGLEILAVPGSSFQYLGLNLRNPYLADRRVRQAIAHAIDREAIMRYLLSGYARAADQLLPPEHWAHASGVETYDYDPGRARALLDEAQVGTTGAGLAAQPVRFRLTYKTSTVELRRRIGEAVAASLAEVGIGVELRPLEWATFYADIRRGGFELFSLAWVGVHEPDHYFAMLHSAMTPPRGGNRGSYVNATIDALTEQGRRQTGRAARRATYAEVAREAARDLPYVPLWWPDNVVVKTPRLAGFKPTASGDLIGLKDAYWVETPAR